MFFKMALLSLQKHKKRTALVVFAVTVSVFFMVVLAGAVDGLKDNFFKTLSEQGGHVQISAEGYAERLNPFSIRYRIDQPETLLGSLEKLPEVESAEALISFGAVLSNGEKSLTSGAVGIDPGTSYFRRVRESLVKGEFLPGGKGMALSRFLMNLLNVSPGDFLLVLVEDSEGSPYYLEFEITGVFETGISDIDENLFFISHQAARELLYIPDESVELRIRLKDPSLADSFIKNNKNIWNKKEQALEVRTWMDLNASFFSMLQMMDAMLVFMNLLLVVVVASVITNALLMNVFERIREFGSLRAIGLKRKQLRGMILAEGAVQGLAGSLAGILLGIPVVIYFQQNGISMGELQDMFGGGSSFTFLLTFKGLLLSGISGVLIALAGSFYASRVGSRLSIMESLNYV